jgi:hypothetical protein
MGDNRMQLLVNPNDGGPANTPILNLQQTECVLDTERCQGKTLFRCERTSKSEFSEVNKGNVLGKCGVTPQFMCEQRQGGTFLEGFCCQGSKSFNVKSPKVVCKPEKFVFFGITLFTKDRCRSTGGKTSCFIGKPIPERGVAVSKKVFNLGGKFVGCGGTSDLKKIIDAKSGGELIAFQPACTVLDFGHTEMLCTQKGVWETIKKKEEGKSFLQRRQPTLGKAEAGTQKCCPIDKCWDGNSCVPVGTEIKVSETKRIRCELTTKSFD